jgi:dipeptidyl-peptidase-4
VRTEGITPYRWAKRANVIVVPNGGDVFVRDAKGGVDRLTDTPAPEIDPKICDTGERVAFVRDGDLCAVDVKTKRETRPSFTPRSSGRGRSSRARSTPRS